MEPYPFKLANPLAADSSFHVGCVGAGSNKGADISGHVIWKCESKSPIADDKSIR